MCVATKDKMMSLKILILLINFIIVIACTTDTKANDGVATTNNNTIRSEDQIAAVPFELSDEDITTKFTNCMRNQGFKTADPAVNADGTVDIQTLKTNIVEDPKYDPKGTKTKKILDQCVPLLENATFTKKQYTEDLIELEDNLIAFSICLRDMGLKVPDPVFNENKRASMKDVLEDIDINSKNNADQIDHCKQTAFGNTINKKG